jgi:acyl carrier protein
MTERIKKILADVLEDHSLEHSLTDNANLITEIGLDSLQMIDFMLRIEEEFDVEIDFEKLNFDDLQSISRFSEYLSTIAV